MNTNHKDRARELLKEEYHNTGNYRAAIQLDDRDNETYHRPMLRAIERALTERDDDLRPNARVQPRP